MRRRSWMIAGLTGLLTLCGWAMLYPSVTRAAEPNIMTCSLSRVGDVFQGSCEVPCLVNNLSVDIDGPKPGVACDAPPRHVPATLRHAAVSGQWLGTMEGKFAEDPKRFEIFSKARMAATASPGRRLAGSRCARQKMIPAPSAW